MSDWLRYRNQGAVRNLPLSDRLTQALSFLPEMGLAVEVFSGGQPVKGSGLPRVGSVRHDRGDAADVFFYQGDRRLDWANPADLPYFEEIVRRGRSAGLTGFGAGPGYMRQGSMHIGYGTPAVWGAGGRSANAPQWLQAAFNNAPVGAAPPIAASAPGAPDSLSSPSGVASAFQPPSFNATLSAPTRAANPLSQLALAFVQDQSANSERRRQEEENEKARRIALFS